MIWLHDKIQLSRQPSARHNTLKLYGITMDKTNLVRKRHFFKEVVSKVTIILL